VLLLCLAGQLHTGDTLEAVRFEGMHAFGRKALAVMVAAKPNKPSNEIQLNNDIATIEGFYHSQGFHAVEVEREVTRGRRRPVVTFHITEGSRTRVNAIAISGNATVGTDRLLRQLSVKPGRFFSLGEFLQSAEALRTYYLNSGYPFVQVQVDTTRNDTLVTLTFEISEGQLCLISRVLLRGNKTVTTRVALRASEVKPGERFSQQHLRQAQRRLYATKLFSRVTYYVIADSSVGPDSIKREVANSVTVRFDVVEQAYRGVGIGGGVEYPPLRAIVSAEWEHDNLFNRGHILIIGGEAGPTLWPFGNYRFAFDGTYRVPYLILTRIDLQTHPYFSYERLDTAVHREVGVETGMSRSIAPQFTVGLANRLRSIAGDTNGVTNSLVLTGNYDSRTDIFDPGQGLWIQTAVEGAGGPLGGDNSLYKLTGDVRLYQKLGIMPTEAEQVSGDFVAAARAMAGVVRPYGRSDSVPYYESFTLGGASSIRGYPERSIGPYHRLTVDTLYHYGPVVANLNLELRSPYILRLVGLVGFVDAGSVATSFRSFAYDYGAGAGIRLKTPIGPIRLDWGKQLRNPPQGDIGRFYVGILHAF